MNGVFGGRVDELPHPSSNMVQCGGESGSIDPDLGYRQKEIGTLFCNDAFCPLGMTT